MSNNLWKLLLTAPAVLGIAYANAAHAESLQNSAAIAPQSSITSTETLVANSSPTLQQVSSYGAEGKGTENLDQVTSVSQFSDVRPTDWAYQALQSLVERYGCIVGYPDKTYRGNRALSRYEFAAGLNACLDKIQELIAAATADFVKKEDLEVVKKLQEEFGAELAVLRGRVDVLEVRTSTLEKQQFSTTTKLSGEVIFAISDTFGNAATRNSVNTGATAAIAKKDNTNTIFSDRVRLNLNTSFSGKDVLSIRLAASNTTPFSGGLTGTNMTRLSFDGGTGALNPAGVAANDNSVRVDKLYYRFPLGTKLRIQVDAINNEFYNGLISPLSGSFASDAQGSISRFGRFNPTIYRQGNPSGVSGGSAGVTFAYKFSDKFRLEGGYIGDAQSNDPSVKNGLFNGSHATIGQLVFSPVSGLDVGVSYAHSYYPGSDVNLTTATGSSLASRPFGASATAADNFGASLQWYVQRKVIVGGWFGYSRAHQRSSSADATIINWAAFLGFPDLGRKGNLGGLLVGMPPKVTDSDLVTRGVRQEDRNTSLHVEAFYRYRLSDNISITPGFFVLFNPEHNNNNDTEFVGTVRTTFTF